MTWHRFRSIVALSTAVLLSLPLSSTAASDSVPEPAVAYQSGDDTVVATSAGEEITRIPVLFGPSLDGNIVAGDGVGGGAGIAPTSAWIVVAHDATTGDALWTVFDARFPTVLDDGNAVAFHPSPDGARDPQVNSLWMADAAGNERLVVQFANGPGLPGYDPGFEGDNAMLSVSFDEDASIAVVAQGNDVSLFIYDIFAVDVATGAVTRLTDGKKSRSPAVSPGGERVVFGWDVGPCEIDYIRASNLMIIDSDGSNERQLFAGTCESWIHNARWISDGEVVAFWSRDRADGRRLTDLVLLDVDTGTMIPLTRSNKPWFFTVDRDTESIAYMVGARLGFTFLDVRSRELTRGPTDGWLPAMTGDHQWP